MQQKVLALFDFDGTITTKDSFVDFLVFSAKKRKIVKNFVKLIPTYLKYKFKIISKRTAKEIVISRFFHGESESSFEYKANLYYKNRISKLVKKSALEQIKWHQSQNHTVVVVSGSISTWLSDWCRKHNLDLIATELEVVNNKLTGKFATENCFGDEKVRRIIQKYNLDEYDYIYAYGNSKGDREMLELANEPYYKYFKK